MKKVGIAIDDYKEELFTKALIKEGFTDFTVKDGIVKGMSVIFLKYEEHETEKLKKAVKKIELSFQTRN